MKTLKFFVDGLIFLFYTHTTCISTSVEFMNFKNRLSSIHYTCINYGETIFHSSYENKQYSKPVILISGSDNPAKIEKFVQKMLEHLEVNEPIFLSVRFYDYMPEDLLGLTTAYIAVGRYKHVVQVLIDSKIRPNKQEAVLAHELIHVKQFSKNELIILNSREVLWKGKKFGDFNVHNQHVPWEQEAKSLEKQLLYSTKQVATIYANYSKNINKRYSP